jgi:hypothetical protein
MPPRQALDTLCVGLRNWYQCAQAIERYQVQQYSQFVARDTSHLTLRLLSGDSLVLSDSVVEGWGGRSYTYCDYLRAIGYHFIHVQYWEGGDYLLVDATSGKSTYIPGVPAISPDGERFVVTSVDLEAGYGPTTVQVWKLRPDSPMLEWQLDPLSLQEGAPTDSLWGISAARWVSPTLIHARREYLQSRLGELVVIKHTAAGWALAEPDA